ncbi:hypothetical protein [Sodalis sp.]|uniref:hypothetical protein n=1 Tax=Sodalis sp. (in: enterobacteria) TaxID=1898979 RepID=UPI0038730D53
MGHSRTDTTADEKGNTGLVNYLPKQLPAEYQTIGNALATLQDNPATLSDFARNVGLPI